MSSWLNVNCNSLIVKRYSHHGGQALNVNARQRYAFLYKWLFGFSSRRDESLVVKTIPHQHIVPEGQNFSGLLLNRIPHHGLMDKLLSAWSSRRDESLVTNTASPNHIVPEGQNFPGHLLNTITHHGLMDTLLSAFSSRRDESLVTNTASPNHIVPEGQNFRMQSAVWKFSAFIIFVFSLFTHPSKANDPAYDFHKANELYQKQNYDSAAKIYESLAAKEYYSADVYYNLGNCYYKLNNVARAILNYERALRFNPDDEDIQFNLKVAQLKVVDKIEPVPEIFYVRWIKAIASLLTPNNWSMLVIACIWIMFLFAAVYVVSSSVTMKRIGFLMAAVFFLISIGVFAISSQSYTQQVRQKRAVVMSMSSYVKSSPGDNNTDLFLLHEGTSMDILDSYENWVKIRIANGSIGWVKSVDIEEI